ncbi:hypothetical protein [Escherichia coli]|uniref:hypothetical protein n=1 Tax=Escherichia coli TaxID=562 RepID=UPI00388DBB79
MGKVKSINTYRLTPGFGGFTPVSYETMECRLSMPLARHLLTINTFIIIIRKKIDRLNKNI